MDNSRTSKSEEDQNVDDFQELIDGRQMLTGEGDQKLRCRRSESLN